MNTSPAEPCKNGHVSARRKSGNCIQCEKERYHADPKRKAYVRQRQAKVREAIKADPVKLAEQKRYMKDYSQRNREKLSEQSLALYRRNNVKIRLQRKGIEATEEIISYIEGHDGKCDICHGLSDGRWKELNMDHCHTTGVFRGMLCTNCNRALGYFKDSPESLRKAIAYLSR